MPDPGFPAVAIVGTRKATAVGIQTAEKIAARLAEAGLIIISGLAMGIDTAAHRGALGARGKTVAVLGNGIDEIYPAQNEKLANEILETGGAIISEYPPAEPSFRGNFIARNRIISGLSVAVVIVEAPVKSGALATAGFAAEQGRSVFVVPGPVTHPNYVGSHALIRDGAVLATNASDILEDLGLLRETGDKRQVTSIEDTAIQSELDSQESLILEVIKTAGQPLEVDRISASANLTPQAVNVILTSLMLKGIVKELNGRYTI
ncbi:MAG: DNA-protecting protein DprA [Candidatus Colwellbacteria bacterium]|nr:DNA-protecting protein DprA [Candidatus Colwellbacteria bacterium]